MSFDVRDKDLLGRVGRLETKSGVVETPSLLPVVNPRMLDIPPGELMEHFGYGAIMTNAYILKKHFEAEALDRGVHRFLNYKGVVVTDSGAYQILRYGKVAVEPLEIVKFQEKISTDIGVILDVPTGWKASRSYAEWTVRETLERAKDAIKHIDRKDILWVGPVQGGRYLDLVAASASKMSKLPFDVYALGSPTEVMEQYLFETLVDMIMNVKLNLPVQKPLHLFGAGHPFMFPFAVALGCDLFDSASYALYAAEDRYITETGTIRLENLEYFPCVCPVCRSGTPSDLRQKPRKERKDFLMRHSLYVCRAEVERVKQAIVEGRLWELLELRARSHPSLLNALNAVGKYSAHLEKYSPSYKPRGILIFGATSLSRPEVIRHRRRVTDEYQKPEKTGVLLLLPQVDSKPFHSSQPYGHVRRMLETTKTIDRVHVCFYTTPFGVVPVEIDDVYPLSQFEVAYPHSHEAKEDIVNAIVDYVKSKRYTDVYLHPDREMLDRQSLKRLRKEIRLTETTQREKPWSKDALRDLKKVLEGAFKKEN